MSLSRLSFSIFLIMIISSCTSQERKNQICFGHHCLDVEVVADDVQRMKGLQFRKSLGENQGMVFIFPYEGKHAFWMKDTFIPLDMIWLDYAKKIVHIEENVKPCKIAPCPSFRPSEDALYTLEVNAGDVKKIGLRVGDIAEFRLKNL